MVSRQIINLVAEPDKSSVSEGERYFQKNKMFPPVMFLMMVVVVVMRMAVVMVMMILMASWY